MPVLYNTSHAKKRFLSHFAKHGRFYAAAKHAGRTGQAVYLWIDNDVKFKAEYEAAKDQFIEKLEQEADRRATEGVNKPVYFRGQLVTDANGNPVIIKEYSDTLLIFRLKALDPAKYREKIEHSGPNGGAIEVLVRWDGNRNETNHTSTPATS